MVILSLSSYILIFFLFIILCLVWILNMFILYIILEYMLILYLDFFSLCTEPPLYFPVPSSLSFQSICLSHKPTNFTSYVSCYIFAIAESCLHYYLKYISLCSPNFDCGVLIFIVNLCSIFIVRFMFFPRIITILLQLLWCPHIMVTYNNLYCPCFRNIYRYFLWRLYYPLMCHLNFP